MSELTSSPATSDKRSQGEGGKPLRRHHKYLLAGSAAVVLAGLAAVFARGGGQSEPLGSVLVGEARRGGLTFALPDAVRDIRIREASVPGRPIVLIDPGHGGRDPGAPAVSRQLTEKQLTLAMATELADLLEKRGRLRVALAREDDRYLSLEQRAAIARRIGASLFVSLHMDSAPNLLARGAKDAGRAKWAQRNRRNARSASIAWASSRTIGARPVAVASRASSSTLLM